jgi:hypothetical protein
MTASVQEARERLAAAEAELASARRALARKEVATALTEPKVNGSVIRWTSKFPHGDGQEYTYTALRAPNGLWYTSMAGKRAVMTWADLQAYWGTVVFTHEPEVAIVWTTVPQAW